MQKIILFISFISLVMTLGCATKELRISTQNVQPLKSMQDKIGFTKIKGSLHIGDFQYAEPDPYRVGTAKTGLFDKLTPVYLDKPIADYIRDQFKLELHKRGLRVDGKSPYTLTGTIQKLTVDENANGLTVESAECNLALEFHVLKTKTQQLVYKGHVSSYVTGTNNALDSTNSIAPTLESCVQFAVEKFLSENEMLSRLDIDKVSTPPNLEPQN